MRQTIYARNGAITAGHPLAAQAGLRILLAGGNAVDAAVATAAALSVVMPDMIGPFGYGFALVAPTGAQRPVVIDMNGVAPRAATREKVAAALAGPTPGVRARTGPMVRGPQAPIVPGLVRGWARMLERWGTRRFADVLQPAIEYAEQGWPLDAEGAMHVKRHIPEIGKLSWADVFLVGGQAPAPGHRLVMKDLARTFRRIAAEGADVLYRGALAHEVDAFFRAEGGWLTAEDLAAYTIQEKEPLAMQYRDLVVYGAPPTSSAMTWMLTMKILESDDLRALGLNSARYLHAVVEATKLAYLETYRWNGDPSFVDVPVDRLLGAAHAADLRKRIGTQAWAVTPAVKAGGPADPRPVGSTTHFNVVDRHGNVVAMTNTLGAFYGAGLVIGDTGMLANDGMDWFDADRSPWTGETSPTVVAPGKRPRLPLSPAIVYRGGRPWMAVGGAGAETTMAGILQPILNVVEFGMDPQAANDAPRFRWGDLMTYTLGTRLRLEAAIGGDVRAEMTRMGHDVVPLTEEPQPLVGNTNMIVIDEGTLKTGANSRGRDAAVGW